MSRAVRRLSLAAALLLTLSIPASVAAFPLTNCTAEVVSLDADGGTLGTATSGADDATQEEPLIVHWDGTVAWSGTSGSQAFGSFSYEVFVFGIPTPLGGSDVNDSGNTEGSGSVAVGENIPLEIVGLFLVSGHVTDSSGYSCEGEGWLLMEGDAVGTVPFWVAVATTLIGIVILLAGRRSRIAAVLGGVLIGLGGAALVIIFATLVLGGWTPLVALGGGILLGVLVAILSGGRAGDLPDLDAAGGGSGGSGGSGGTSTPGGGTTAAPPPEARADTATPEEVDQVLDDILDSGARAGAESPPPSPPAAPNMVEDFVDETLDAMADGPGPRGPDPKP